MSVLGPDFPGGHMTPVEAHAWLVTRWQEKLDTARAAGERHGHDWAAVPVVYGPPEDGWGEPSDWEVAGRDGDVVSHMRHEGGGTDALGAAHIAAFDPAFAIAVCEAALRRLARHAPFGTSGRLCDHNSSFTSWPCVEVLDDAAPFIDRDDFPQELKA